MTSDALLTDLYELTMLDAYLASDMRQTAVFELFVRRLPPKRGFLVCAGLEQALRYLEELRFDEDAIAYLERTGRFRPGLAERLRSFRFTGDVDAIPEGTVVFEGEPLVRVVAPLPEAQLVEATLMNLVHFQTLVASKAARCVLAAGGKELVDFGLRRAHGGDAGVLGARAAYVAGFHGTSTVLAGKEHGVPVFGTMAHSFVQAHDDELDAFRAFARASAEPPVLLIDTYDTEAGAKKVVALAKEGIAVRGVRIDSGDLAAHAHRVRRILDAGGLGACVIVASGGLDEESIASLVASGAPIDGFGVGTRLETSADAPYLDCVYKLEEYAGRPRRKRSEGKATLPGRKQVTRRFTPDGDMAEDVVTLAGDIVDGVALLGPAMRGGRRVAPPTPLATIRARAAEQLRRLPPHLRRLRTAPPYPVRVAPSVAHLAQAFDLAG